MNPPILLRAASRLAPCALLALLAHQAHAQSRMTDAPEAVPAAIREVSHGAPTELMFDTGADGAIWARGRGFKASFDGDRATIVPFFGSEAPQNYPIVFRAGGATLARESLSGEPATRAVRTERTVSIDRAAFVEEYELNEERLEQRFVFDSLPRRGDLVMRIGVETELAVTEDGDALRFSNELGHVDYGQAFAIDANGARIALERTYADGEIALTVPESFVAGAAMPLTIDPLITFFTVSGMAHVEYLPDISYDVSSDRWCAVWEDVWSTVDHDVFAKVMTSGGANLGLLGIDFTPDYWARPKIANNNGSNVFLVVAEVDPAPTTSNFSTIRGCRITPATIVAGTPFLISPSDSDNRIKADVGGDQFSGTSSKFCVVWQHQVNSTTTHIEMQMVNPTGALSGAVVTLDTFGVNTRPAISKSVGIVDVGAPERWTVTWQYEFSSTDHDIHARQVRWDGVPLTGLIGVDVSTEDETEPAVSTVLDPVSGQRYALVVYQRDAGADEDIIGTLINGTTVLQPRNLSSDHPATSSHRQLSPRVDSDGRHFLVGHIEIAPSGVDPNVWISDYFVSADALVPCAVHENLAGSPAAEYHIALHSSYSSGGARERYFGAWSYQSVSNGYDIQGALWDGCTGGRITSYCFGDGSGTACPCGNNGSSGNGCASSVNASGARLSGTGDASVVADTLVLQGIGMPATASCLYFQGSAQQSGGSGSVFGDGKRCASGTVIRLGTKTNSIGASQYPTGGDPPVSVRGVVPAGGATRFYQAWYRNAAVFCTTSTFNLTNGLQVVWAP